MDCDERIDIKDGAKEHPAAKDEERKDKEHAQSPIDRVESELTVSRADSHADIRINAPQRFPFAAM